MFIKPVAFLFVGIGALIGLAVFSLVSSIDREDPRPILIFVLSAILWFITWAGIIAQNVAECG